MGRLLWLTVGLVAGVVLAARLTRTPTGSHVLTRVDETAGEFRRAVSDSYRAHRAQTGAP